MNLPVRLLYPSGDLSVDEGRETDGDRVYPEDRDVLFYTAVSDDVLVPQRLCKRSQTVHRDSHAHQHAYAAKRDYDAVRHDAKGRDAIFR